MSIEEGELDWIGLSSLKRGFTTKHPDEIDGESRKRRIVGWVRAVVKYEGICY